MPASAGSAVDQKGMEMETNAWKEAELRKSLAVKTARPVPHVRRSRSSQQTSLTNSWDMPVFSSASLANSVKHGPLTPGAKIGLRSSRTEPAPRRSLRWISTRRAAEAGRPKGGLRTPAGGIAFEPLGHESGWRSQRDVVRARPAAVRCKSRAPRSAGWGRAASLNSVTRRI